MSEQVETKASEALQEEIRELEDRSRQAVDAAAAAREDESVTEEERQRLEDAAARALDEAEAAKARLSRTSEVDSVVRERQEERERERRLEEAEETRRRHEQRYNELARERHKLEERTEKEAARLRSTLEELLELDKEQRDQWTHAGGQIGFGGTPFKARLGDWFRATFSKPFNTGPVPYSGTDPYNGASLVERDEWAEESQISRDAARKHLVKVGVLTKAEAEAEAGNV